MIIELIKLGLKCEQQKNVKVYYDGMEIGDYFADVVVEDRVILELKAVERIAPEHEVQLVNYLKATKIEIGLLLNFGPKAEIRRKIYSNNYLRNQI
jgi:GxxExxY protein